MVSVALGKLVDHELNCKSVYIQEIFCFCALKEHSFLSSTLILFCVWCFLFYFKDLDFLY